MFKHCLIKVYKIHRFINKYLFKAQIEICFSGIIKHQ